ncbi:MAG: hypothetical protein H8E34_05155 [Bacteroidetes bacterium]|nr:hypothetical protein [Bacteroidota bacterium]MBL6944728.1 hypothetical protein [Bacteroidales bacterium]
MHKRVLLLVLVSFALISLKAQVNVRDSVVPAFIPHVSYSFQFPGGDIAKRYGDNSTIGIGLKYHTSKNFIFSLDGNFIFGSDIKNADSILWMVETQDGFIIDGNGTYALYALYERGYNVNFSFGKILPVLNPNPNSGLMITAGVGSLVHRMKIDNQHRTAPQISDDYALGYDMLTGGFSLNQFIGWFYMDNSRYTNFYAGFEFHQAFTQSLRDWNFSTMKQDDNKYFDYFIGIKIGWMLPIYKRAPDKFYYN